CVGHACRRQDCASGIVEIVEVMIVAQQDCVELADIPWQKGGARGLHVHDRTVRTPVLARRIEGGVREKTQPVIFDEDGRPSYQGQLDVRGAHGHFPATDAERYYSAGPDRPVLRTGPRSRYGVWLRVFIAQSAISS